MKRNNVWWHYHYHNDTATLTWYGKKNICIQYTIKSGSTEAFQNPITLMIINIIFQDLTLFEDLIPNGINKTPNVLLPIHSSQLFNTRALNELSCCSGYSNSIMGHP